MPSAFTAPITNDEEFTWIDYLERCVHNFIRYDENINGRLPDEIKPYHQETENDIELLLAEHEQLQKLSHPQRIEKGRAVIRKREETLREYRARAEAYNEKYDAILSKVVQWIPPTERHEEFKKFAISQIEGSKLRLSDYDGELEYLKKYSPETAFEDYCNNLRVRAQNIRENIDRSNNFATSSTQWLKELRSSLDESAPA